MLLTSKFLGVRINNLTLLGVFTGLQIEFIPGFYSSHLVILLLFIGFTKYQKFELLLYFAFVFFCTASTILNISIAGSFANFKFINLLNTIILYSVVLIRITRDQFLAFFRGVIISFYFLCLVVLANFKLSLLENGFFSFFVQERDWFENLSFFGNTFAIYGVIVAYINYKILYKNIFLMLGIALLLILTTSRLSLFGLIFVVYFFIKDYFLKSIKGKIILIIFTSIAAFVLMDFSLSNFDNFELFSNRLEYSNDRESLTIIAKQLFLNSPIFGNGPIYIEKYTHLEPHLHNIWYDIGVGYGLLGLLFYFILFFRKILFHLLIHKDLLFIVFILVASFTQISLKAPFVGILLFPYLNLSFPSKYIKNNFFQ